MKHYKELHPKDASFCSSTGFIGLLLALTTFLQFMFVVISGSFVLPLFSVLYLFCCISFLLFMLKKKYSPYLVLASTLIIFLIFIFYLLTITFSLILFLLLIYCIVISILILVNDIPSKLKYHHEYLQEEGDYWTDKL